MDDSIKAIRRRLFFLLLKSYVIVVIISILIIIAAVVWTIFQSTNESPIENMPMIARLEGYYQGNDQQLGWGSNDHQ